MRSVRYSYRYTFLAFALGALLFAPAGPAGFASDIDILNQWTGIESGYAGRPAYFVIRSLPELQVFWEQHAATEPMPTVDFGSRMLFCWVPGPSLIGYRVLKAVRVVKEGGGHVLELDVKRSDEAGAGQWRSPWLMALLPKFRGDIRVVRKGARDEGEAARMPLAIVYDMGGGQVGHGVTTVSVSAGRSAGGAATPSVPHAHAGAAKAPVSGAAATVPPPAKAAESKPENPPATADAGPPKPSVDSAAAKPAETKQPAASGEADPFGDAFNLDF